MGMTDEDILKRAMEKAFNNDKNASCLRDWGIYIGTTQYLLYREIIFNHSFAKAFWGKDPKICSACKRHHEFSSDCDAGFGIADFEHWEYHLQKMVLEEEPHKYIERFL